ncbi:hypothetical protein JTB14_035347 [Gonioctena quinquepunctata]|nr:hypothetical protein JTB14_035347 [Gonioctena quinquepunctata]
MEIDDAILIDLVRQFPALYDKSMKEFKDKNVKDNAWGTIASTLNVDGPRSMKESWTAPQKIKCREYFNDYYEHRKQTKYPTVEELQEAIATVPEIEVKTVPILRSQLQHDYEYMKRENK